jgi:excisionase family DNA binding protein
MEDRLLKAAEVAELLRVKESTIYKWVHYGYIPHIKLGSSLRFNRDSVLKWARNNENKGKKLPSS